MREAGHRADETPSVAVPCASAKPLRIRLRDLAEWRITRARHNQIIGYVEQQAAFLDVEVRAALLQNLRAALDADMRRQFEERKAA